MYAGERAVSISHNTAKSCIQALLKAREQHQLQKLPRKFSQRNIDHFSGGFAIESKVLNLPFANKINENISNEALPYDDVDDQNDFNYSQKLFHISDGNLYSIFSPIQGRSYGMKPSFLRKQKYTVQECHGRGRKNLRKGLKFHNFLPSESTTSEKNNNGAAQTKWKVHSECRLREEHGTKQITISNWSQNIHNLTEEPIQQNSFTNSDLKPSQSVSKDPETNYNQNATNSQNACDDDPYNFQLPTSEFLNEKFYYNPEQSYDTEPKRQTSNKASTSKKGSLKFVLNSLLEKPLTAESPELPVAHSKSSSSNQKHRRKPTQTKRVVPYTKYLSILEEDDDTACPLDLSSKYSGAKCHSPMSSEEDFIVSSKKTSSNCDNIDSFMDNMSMSDNKQIAPSNSKLYSAFNNNNFKNSSSLAHLLQNQIPSPLVLLTSPVLNNLNVRPSCSATNSEMYNTPETLDGKHKASLNLTQIKPKSIYPSPQTNCGPSYPNNVQYAVHKSFIKNSQPKSRRRSQRSVIKKNLEDTFKQNGFLVKTKQVSDGEATFCKFRQLRKYTRYYLKSWQQHLPDEVNKMWKGFLPPKTVLPPVSAAPETTIGNK